MAEQKQPPISPQQGRMKSGKEEQHSTFSKWRKRWSSKPKPADISVSPAALALLHVSGLERSAAQRTLQRAIRRWATNVATAQARSHQRRQEQPHIVQPAFQPSLTVEPRSPGSHLSMGLASTVGSPLARPYLPTDSGSEANGNSRQGPTHINDADENAKVDPMRGRLPASPTAPTSHPDTATANVSDAGATASATDRTLNQNQIQNQMSPPSHRITSPRHSHQYQPNSTPALLRSMETIGEDAAAAAAAAPSARQTQTVRTALTHPPLSAPPTASAATDVFSPSMPSSKLPTVPESHLQLPSRPPSHTRTDSATSTMSDGTSSNAAARLALSSPWTSARPMRPSILQTSTGAAGTGGRRSTLVPSRALSLLSPALAFSRLTQKDGVGDASAAAATGPGPSSRRLPVPVPVPRPITPPSPGRPTDVVLSPQGKSDGSVGASSSSSMAMGKVTPPHGMEAHPRGSVMLGGLKEWNEQTIAHPPETVTKEPTADAAISAPSSMPESTRAPSSSLPSMPLSPSTDTAAAAAAFARRRRHTICVNRWRGAIRQIVALATWARMRTVTRRMSLIEQQAAAAAAAADASDRTTTDIAAEELISPRVHEEELIPQEAEITRSPSANAVVSKTDLDETTPIAIPSTESVAAPTRLITDTSKLLIPRATLLDYFLVYGLSDELLQPLGADLERIRSGGGNGNGSHGMTSRTNLESIAAAFNTHLQTSGSITNPSCLHRFPFMDRPHFPVDHAWSQFAFPDTSNSTANGAAASDLSVSVTPRETMVYSSVMTLANGVPIFATYLRWDQPLLPHVPSAFYPDPTNVAQANIGQRSAPVPASSPSSPHVHFWDDPKQQQQQQQQQQSKSTPSTPALIPGTFSPPLAHVAPDTPQSGFRPPSTFTSPDPAHPHHHHSRSQSYYPTTPYSHHEQVYHPQLYVPRAMVLISHYPCFDILRHLAEELFELACSPGCQSHETGVALESALVALCFEHPLPVGGKYATQFKLHRNIYTMTFPAIRSSLHSTLNMEGLFKVLNVDNIIGILAALLTEQKLLFHSSSLSLLCYTMQCCLQLLFPFDWWYAYVPHLTSEMLDAVDLPQPYCLGLHSKYLSSIHSLDEVLLVDIDHDILRCSKLLTPLPMKEGRELWLGFRRCVETFLIKKHDRMKDARLERAQTWWKGNAKHQKPEKLDTGHDSDTLKSNICTNHPEPTSMHSKGQQHTLKPNMHHGSFIPAPGSGNQTLDTKPAPPTLTPSSRSGALKSRSDASVSSLIASPFPPAPASFDESIYVCLLHFYASLLAGYRKYLFFICGVPFFNAEGYVQSRLSSYGGGDSGMDTDGKHDDPSAAASQRMQCLDFYKRFVSSRAFDVYIEEESQRDPYHDFLATGLPVKRAAEIIQRDLAASKELKLIKLPVPNAMEKIQAEIETNRKKPKQLQQANNAKVNNEDVANNAMDPKSQSQLNLHPVPHHRYKLVDAELVEVGDDAVFHAVQVADDAGQMTSMHSQTPSDINPCPFSQQLRMHLFPASVLPPTGLSPAPGTGTDPTASKDASTSISSPIDPAVAPALRSFIWDGLAEDLPLFMHQSLHHQPRKPKRLSDTDYVDAMRGEGEMSHEGENGQEVAATSEWQHRPPISVTEPPSVRNAPHLSPSSTATELTSSTTPSLSTTPSPSSFVSTPAHLSQSDRRHSGSSSRSLSGNGHGHAQGQGHEGVDHRIKMLLSRIFSSQQLLDKNEMKEFTQLLTDVGARRIFASILAQPKRSATAAQSDRSKSGSGIGGGTVSSPGGGGSASLCLTRQGFEQLSTLVRSLLDQCVAQHDYVAASDVLDALLVYYCPSGVGSRPSSDGTGGGSTSGVGGGGGSSSNSSSTGIGVGGHTRTYLESMVRKHPLWRDTQFWRANLSLALNQRAARMAASAGGSRSRRCYAPNSTSVTPSRIPVVQSDSATSSSSPQPPASAEDSEFILQWMLSASHQLMNQGLGVGEVSKLMDELATTYRIKSEHVATIHTFLTNLSRVQEALS